LFLGVALIPAETKNNGRQKKQISENGIKNIMSRFFGSSGMKNALNLSKNTV
jgi:hypothetical protein